MPPFPRRLLLATALVTGLLVATVPAQETAPAPAADPAIAAPPPADAGGSPSIPAGVAPSIPAGGSLSLPERIDPRPVVVLPRVGDYHRAAQHVDPVESLLARGKWRAPKAGDKLLDASGREASWREPSEKPAADLAGGYLFTQFDAPAAGVMLLEAPGCAAVCVNGEWLPGDPYNTGWFRLPLEVRAGENWLLAHLASPGARPRLVRPGAPVVLLAEAATLPDLLVESKETKLALSVPLRNASSEPLARCRLRWNWQGEEPTTEPLRRIDSLLITPLTLTVKPPVAKYEPGAELTLRVSILPEVSDEPLAATELKLRVVAADAPRTDTFVSAIDGSVQPYAVLPAKGAAPGPAVVVSLHDAGESPRQRLAKHAASEGVYVLAPGGRGRWGFDGEDWSARDALEALDDFTRRQQAQGQAIDPRRVSLLGEGMGGHAALRLATLYPDRFVAAGLVDGWISFYTQGGARPAPSDAAPIAELLGRQASSNDPLRVIENLRGVALHLRSRGAQGVGPTEARFLRERLGEFHDDFVYREAPAESDAALVAEQVAWVTSRRLPEAGSAEIDFATPNPGVSATRDGVTIVTPRRHGEVARVRLTRDAKARIIRGETTNVRRLELDLSAWSDKGEASVQLDGERAVKFRPGREGVLLSLARDREGEWRRVPDRSPAPGVFKAPPRVGGFKSAFAARPQLVYGTRGSEGERCWSAAKARYDAHLFLYRGAGLLEVLPDSEMRSSLREATPLRRSVVLYGSAPTNSAWVILEQENFFRRRRALRVEEGIAWLGDRPESGEDLAVLAVRPRLGDSEASVAIVGGTGEVGMRLTTRLRYFWAGVEYPDYLLMGPEIFEAPADPKGARDVRAAGYFDSDWGVDEGGILWRDLAI